MIEYIYIVKCPGREDEMFNFFTDARMQCDLLMSKKPIITQVEVERNDFGECTDHHDLGTVWSWEEAMKDTEDGDYKPITTVFTKDDLKLMADGKDPEFDDLDNSVDCEVEEPETPEISSAERKPIPDGMTIEELVEEMEENEDEVECTWCNDLFDKSECRKEVNLGWLCSRCEAAIKSRGEPLTFRENNYWDFLDEDTKRDPFDHHDPDYDEDESADYLADLVDGAKDDLYDRSLDTLEEASLSDIAAAANSEFGSSWDDDYLLDIAGVDDDFRNASHSTNNKTKEKSIKQPKENCVSDFEKKKADYEARAKRYIEAGKAAEYNDRYDREIVLRDWCPAIDVETNELIYDKAIKQVIAQKAFEGRRARYAAQRKAYASRPKWLCAYTVNGKTYETTTAMGDDAEAARQAVVNKVKKAELEAQKFGEPFDWDGTVKIIKCTKPDGTEEVFEGFDPEELHDLGNEYDGGYPTEKPELPEIDEVSDSHLKLCPECGKETFDIETGICVDCGFN